MADRSEQLSPFRAQLPLRIGPCAPTQLVDVRVLPKPSHGICLWWSLPGVYRILKGDDHMSFGRLKSKRWDTWQAFVNEADFGGADLLKSKVLHASKCDEGPATCEFGFDCASTRAFLLLALRWCSGNKQTGRIDFLTAGLRLMLDCLLSQVSGSIRVAGAGPISTTDVAVQGGRMVEFVVECGRVQLGRARSARPLDILRNLPGLPEDAKECSLSALLLAAPCMTMRLSTDFGYLAQMVWVIAPMLEEALLQCSPASAADWPSASALKGPCAELGRYERGAFAYAYVQASAKVFADSQVLSVAVDDGRVGRSPWKLGAVIDPAKNFAAWMLPQVVSAQGLEPS